ncbi:MAG: hypothetical protein CO094_13150 [Anaerolineae bacterium CG_4_9_14_3_um_filter_57_17]|nr:hypothetical protein [bacterium]NCT21282.1 hypothetical protein [bacterium]OIO86493.1 MAG: hypothetical protein AUK01_03170 [Anaerolineae bacterium CG2_30_57_67]PJB64475.1 MAG: hypothetical protein CO094_13150 [Anaerolineae bacterium CG_4_9_14_3_um_filter_57_17]
MKLGPLTLNFRRIFIFIGIGILLLLILDFNSRLESLTRLKNEAATISAQATGIMVTQSALATRVAYATSDAAVEAWAREQGGMALPGDKVLAPLGIPGAIPLPTPTPPPPMQQMEPWQIWLEFLFGAQ